jgi:AcrR family transcriptional regulator
MNPTRQRILDTAEVCFAQRGFDGTSLREITAQAGVNLGAVNYHFGSKAGLFDEVLRRRLEPMNRWRLELLDAAIARHDPKPAPLEEILEAFLRPPVEALATPARGTILGLIRRVNEGTIDPSQFEDLFGVVLRRFSILRTRIGPVSDQEFQGRVRFMVGGMIHLLTDRTWGGASFDSETVVQMLVTWAAAVMRAPGLPLDNYEMEDAK